MTSRHGVKGQGRARSLYDEQLQRIQFEKKMRAARNPGRIFFPGGAGEALPPDHDPVSPAAENGTPVR